jgi:hypothetical protein
MHPCVGNEGIQRGGTGIDLDLRPRLSLRLGVSTRRIVQRKMSCIKEL